MKSADEIRAIFDEASAERCKEAQKICDTHIESMLIKCATEGTRTCEFLIKKYAYEVIAILRKAGFTVKVPGRIKDDNTATIVVSIVKE